MAGEQILQRKLIERLRSYLFNRCCGRMIARRCFLLLYQVKLKGMAGFQSHYSEIEKINDLRRRHTDEMSGATEMVI